jgi:ABC-type lipoprotein export system ATPase subunit
MIELIDIEKQYRRGSEEVYALRGINLNISRGEFVSITGPSGSGKTTMLHIIGCLDRPTRGVVRIDGTEVETLQEAELVRIRRQKIGFVFQQFYLIPGLSVIENVELALLFGRKNQERDRIVSLLDLVGLRDRLSHNPNELSGGEMQRVAIARALIADPEFLLADEPTGNLDTENSAKIFALLKFLHTNGKTVIVVTHNGELAMTADRVIRIKDGRVHK